MNLSDIKWKVFQHKDLIYAGRNHSLIREISSSDYREMSYRIWYELPKILAKSQGCEFTEDTPNSALNELFVRNIYNIPEFVPHEGDVVLDVGASFGDSSIWWAKLFGANVVAFEPLQDVFNILERNIKLNKAKVEAHNVAIGSGNKIIGTREGDMLQLSNTGKKITMTTKRLDDYNFNHIDLLKIDVEGFEFDSLIGALESIRKSKPRIILETHSKHLRAKCSELLSNEGYRLVSKGRKTKPKESWMDLVQNLFFLPIT